MANRRMFSLDVVDSAEFLELPLQAQALYFHLGMHADDDGFVRNHLQIMRMLKVRKMYLNVLIMQNFVIETKSGVIIIKHWRMNNYIPSDRYTSTIYQAEKACLKEVNRIYVYNADTTADTRCIQGVSSMGHNTDTESIHSIDKSSKDKLSKDKCSCTTTVKYIPSLEDIQTYINNNNYTFNAEYFYNYYKAKGWRIGSTPIVNFEALKAIMDNWQAREQPKAEEQRTPVGDIFIEAGERIMKRMEQQRKEGEIN